MSVVTRSTAKSFLQGCVSVLCNRDPDSVPRSHSTRFQPQRCFTAPCPGCTCGPSQLWPPISQGSLAATKLGQNQGWCLWSICIQSTEPQTCEKWLSLVKEGLIYRGVCLLRGHVGGQKSKTPTDIRKYPMQYLRGRTEIVMMAVDRRDAPVIISFSVSLFYLLTCRFNQHFFDVVSDQQDLTPVSRNWQQDSPHTVEITLNLEAWASAEEVGRQPWVGQNPPPVTDTTPLRSFTLLCI